MTQESYTEELTDYEINRRTEIVWGTWAVYDTVREREIVRGSLKLCNNYWQHTWNPERFPVIKSIMQEIREYVILPIMEDIEDPCGPLTQKTIGWYIECPDGSVFNRYPLKTYKKKASFSRSYYFPDGSKSKMGRVPYYEEVTKTDLWLPRMIVRSLNFLLRELNEKVQDPRSPAS